MRLKARSLFIKIFLWFWLVTALTGIILFVVAITEDTARNRDVQQRRAEERRLQMAETLSFYGETAIRQMTIEGAQAVNAYSEQLARTAGIKPYFFIQPEKPLPNFKVPGIVMELAKRSRLSGKTEYATERDEFILAQPLLDSSGKIYVIVGKTRLDPSGAEAPESRRPPQEAENACTNKRQGDDCSYKSFSGEMKGKCQATADSPLACIPGKTVPDRLYRQLPVEPDAPETLKAYLLKSRFVKMAMSHLDRYSKKMAQVLIIVFIVGGVACYLLTWHLTAPLRRLQSVAQQLAAGDLSARVDNDLKRRGDEIAELGGDLNRMAEQIENLFSSQQRLMCDISHELRSPLTRLSVALDLARKTAGSGAANSLDRIERESSRLNELIGQLLTLTKLETENACELTEEVDLTAMLAEIARDADFEAQSSNKSVCFASCPSVISTGNRELLRQAFENVVRNAIRYTAEGTDVEISLRIHEQPHGNRITVKVKDYGTGVPEKDLQNIFKPFYRVSDGRERESGGAGIGLAITDRAVRLHGGSVQASNESNGGLIVRIELPVM